jgi:hypothetical protein
MKNEKFWYYNGRVWIAKHGSLAALLAARLGYLVAYSK